MIPGYYFFLFIIFSYAFRLRDFGAPIYINLTYLCIPLAAYVAHRYRWQGVIVTALGGILLPIGLQTRGEIGGFPPALHVYLLSLVTALWVVRGELPEKLITWLKSPYIYGLALLVLPLSLRYFEIQFTDEQGVYFGFSLILMLFYLLFMLGFYRARFGMVATGLLIAVIIGFLINYFSLPLSGSYLRQNEISPYLKFVYYANNLDDLLIGLVSFFVGAQYRSIMQGDPQTRQTKLLTGFGVLIIIVMWMFNHYYFRISGESLKISSAYFVPVASLYFGLKFRANGIAIAFFVALVGVFVTAYLRGRLGSLYLHEFFYVLAFAILGKQLREHVTGERKSVV